MIEFGQADRAFVVLERLSERYGFKALVLVFVEEVLLPADESLRGDEKHAERDHPNQGVHVDQEVDVEVGEFQLLQLVCIVGKDIVLLERNKLNFDFTNVEGDRDCEEGEEGKEDEVVELIELKRGNHGYEE